MDPPDHLVMICPVDSPFDKVRTDLDTTPSRYPKRKRERVRYDECDTDEYASHHSEDDRVPIKKKATTSKSAVTSTPAVTSKSAVTSESAMTSKSAKPLPTRQIFPFMKLPAELRNRIYEECLTDDEPIYITNRQRLYRRVARRDLQWKRSRVFYAWYEAGNTPHADREEQQQKAKPLVPVILAVSKTIYAEAVPILYSQHIVVSDNRVLLDFVAALTPRCAALLRDITIASWCASNSHKSVNLPAMALLAARGVTNLTRLNLNCRLGGFRSWSYRNKDQATPIPQRVARKVFSDCYHWLVAVGEARGDPYAALDVLKVSERNFSDCGDKWNGENNKRLMAKAEEEMKQQVRNLLDRM